MQKKIDVKIPEPKTKSVNIRISKSQHIFIKKEMKKVALDYIRILEDIIFHKYYDRKALDFAITSIVCFEHTDMDFPEIHFYRNIIYRKSIRIIKLCYVNKINNSF